MKRLKFADLVLLSAIEIAVLCVIVVNLLFV